MPHELAVHPLEAHGPHSQRVDVHEPHAQHSVKQRAISAIDQKDEKVHDREKLECGFEERDRFPRAPLPTFWRIVAPGCRSGVPIQAIPQPRSSDLQDAIQCLDADSFSKRQAPGCTFCQPVRGFILSASRYFKFCIRLPYLHRATTKQ